MQKLQHSIQIEHCAKHIRTEFKKVMTQGRCTDPKPRIDIVQKWSDRYNLSPIFMEKLLMKKTN